MIALLLELLNLFGDPLEARQRVEADEAEALRDLARQLGGDDGLDHRAVRREVAQRLAALEDVVQQHAADLVAGHQVILARVVLDGDAHAVAVRVRAEDAVRAHLVGQLHSQRERRRVLRIGHLDGGEIRVGQLLLLDDVDILNADLLEDAADGLVAGAVERRIDDLEFLARGLHQLGLDGQRLDLRDVVVVHFLAADDLQQPLRLRLGLVHLHRVLVAVGADAREHLIGILRRHLRAVLPIDLVAVILRRVVAGGDDDARDGVQMAHRVGKNRHRAQLVKQIHVDALVAEHERGSLRELRAHPAGIIRDDHAALAVFRVLAVDVIGKALGRAANVVQVHAVCARAEHAAHARRAEGQLGIKTILDFLFIARDGLQLIDGRPVVGKFLEPGFVCFTIRHGFHPPSRL